MEDRRPEMVTFPSRRGAEAAAEALRLGGVGIESLSLVGRDRHTDRHAFGGPFTGEGVRPPREPDGSCCRLWEELQVSGFFWMDDQGPFLVAGSLATVSFDAILDSDGTEGANAISAGMYGLGVPREGVHRAEEAMKNGEFILILDGSCPRSDLARRILDHATGAGGKHRESGRERRSED